MGIKVDTTTLDPQTNLQAPETKSSGGIVVDDVNKINPDWCTHKVSGESAPVVVIEKTPEPANNEDMVCTRIEGCEVDLNAVTPEEYCPTCVWKSELKKIKIINFI